MSNTNIATTQLAEVIDAVKLDERTRDTYEYVAAIEQIITTNIDQFMREAEGNPVIRIVFTKADVEAMAEEQELPIEVAMKNAESWSKYITDYAVELINEQLYDRIGDSQ